MREDSSEDYGADQQRLQISDPHFDKFLTPATFACWKIRFKTEVCTCSQFPTEAMLWINESVDDLKSSRSIRGTPGPNFELLDARFASALIKIIQNTRFLKKVSLEEMKAHKEDRFLRGRRMTHLIYEYFGVTEANDSVENYADLFTVVLRNDDVQEFDSKWDEIQLSVTQIPSDNILASLYNLRIRGSEKLKTCAHKASVSYGHLEVVHTLCVQVLILLNCLTKVVSRSIVSFQVLLRRLLLVTLEQQFCNSVSRSCQTFSISRYGAAEVYNDNSNIRKPIRCVRFTKAVLRHADIRDQNPSLGMICPGDHPTPPKFEDRSQEETEWQERCAREAARGSWPNFFFSKIKGET